MILRLARHLRALWLQASEIDGLEGAGALADAAVLNNHPDVDGLTLGLAATTAATRRAVADVEARWRRIFDLTRTVVPGPGRLPS